MTTRTWWFAGLGAAGVCVLAMAGVAVAAIAGTSAVDADIDRARVVRGSVQARMMVSGTLLPRTRSAVSFQAPGRVSRVLVAPREWVRQGQPLATLDAAQLQANVRRRTFELERAWLRAGSARRPGLDDEGQARLADLDVQQAAFELELAETHLDSATLRAPADGTVAHVGVQEGDMVGGTPGGAAHFIIAADDRYVVELEGDEGEIRRARTGASATVFFSAPDAAIIPGRVEGTPMVRRIASGPAASTTLAISVALERNPVDVQIGRAARADIVLETRDEVPIVPLQALFRRDGRDQMLVWRDARWVPTVVALGLVDEHVAELLEGPPLGSLVAVAPSHRLREVAQRHER
jgi:multidrug efflux pump subunit AcrA (membrane-fusion protein)